MGGGLSLQDVSVNRRGSLPAENVAQGLHVGGVLVAALDGRAHGFTFGVDIRAHSVFAFRDVQADLSLNTSLGFGFY